MLIFIFYVAIPIMFGKISASILHQNFQIKYQESKIEYGSQEEKRSELRSRLGSKIK